MAIEAGYVSIGGTNYEVCRDLMGDILVFDTSKSSCLFRVEQSDLPKFEGANIRDLIGIYRVGRSDGVQIGMDRMRSKVRSALA